MPSGTDPERSCTLVLGAFYEVYNALKYGYLEQVYASALAVEFGHRRLRFQREHPIDVLYRGNVVGHYRADFVVEDALVVEVKAGRSMDEGARWQTLNYLRATGLRHGVVLYFGVKPTFRRLIH
jgi:GxxExxY protein